MKIADNPKLLLIKDRIAIVKKRALTLDPKVEVANLKRQYVELSTMSNSFNSVFSSQGWIDNDSMGMQAMSKALNLSKSKV
ncbi:MAG: hypothetical protein JWP57_1384 [Spirosoma sp.]|nr:hypothetical protein [Spirosoma sp.]